jgi:uncharacterized membrane protein YedE/YeeE
MEMLAGVAAFFAAVFGAGYVLGWIRGARWLDDPSPSSSRTPLSHARGDEGGANIEGGMWR